ncbi:MAG: TlpA family protein disulfide reductase [Magnetospiraceae bacterium]
MVSLRRIVLFAALLAWLPACSEEATPTPRGGDTLAPIQAAIPGFTAFTEPTLAPKAAFYDEAGGAVHLTQYRGKVVVLNLWATWCPPCIREMPALHRLQMAEGGADFQVIAIASGVQGRVSASDFLRAEKLPGLRAFTDPDSGFLREMGLDTLPTSLLIDRSGYVVGGVTGAAEWDHEGVRKTIRALAAKP